MKKSCFLIIFIASFLVVAACTKTDNKPPVRISAELNSDAPDFTLKDLSGRNISLSDYRGKVVLLEFWATWCPPCRASVPALVELNNKYGQRGFVVLAVSMDTDSDASDNLSHFSVSNKINYPVLFADEAAPKAYNVVSIPTSFLIGKDGKIVNIYRGYSDELDNKISAQIVKLL